jgi:hypothetical protein
MVMRCGKLALPKGEGEEKEVIQGVGTSTRECDRMAGRSDTLLLRMMYSERFSLK